MCDVFCSGAAQAGKKVLQLDSQGHYGGRWATLPLVEALEYIKSNYTSCSILSSGREGLDEVMKTCSVDLAPKLLYGAGPMITLLLESGAHNYTEFKFIDRRYMWSKGEFVPIASSRSEIFKDTRLTLSQKNALMRALKSIMERDQCNMKESVAQVLKTHQVDKQLRDIFVLGVLMKQHHDEVTIGEAQHLLELFTDSFGRYGPDSKPFLYPMYGCGELSQAFCRTAAVHGALQCLRQDVVAINHVGDGYEVEIQNGQTIRCPLVCTTTSEVQKALVRDGQKCFDLPRQVMPMCFALLDGRVFADDEQAFAVIPLGEDENSPCVWALQLTSSTRHCPDGFSILHLWSWSSIGDAADHQSDQLKTALHKIADCSEIESKWSACNPASNAHDSVARERAKVLFACFCAEAYTSGQYSEQLEKEYPGLALCQDLFGEPTLVEYPNKAAECFRKLMGDDSALFGLDTNNEEEALANDSDEDLISSLEEALR